MTTTKKNAPQAAGTVHSAENITEQKEYSTMAKKKQVSAEDLSLMDEIMQAVEQTGQAASIDNENPEMAYLAGKHQKLVEKVAPFLTVAEKEAFEESFASYGVAVAAAYTLYGMHVMSVLLNVAANPNQLSKHVMERLGLI